MRRLYGALKQGGKVRICSPDYEAFVEKLNKNLKKDPLLAAIEFHHDLLSHPLLRPSIKKKLLMRFTGHVHHWYPFSFLIESMLKSVGFKCITFHTFRSGTFPDLEKIENRDKASFYVEAVKL